MTIALNVFGALLAFAAIGSAISKILKVPDVMKAMEAVGVKPHQIPVLATLEIPGRLGLIAGIWNAPLGQLATICLALYFAGAVISHITKKHALSDAGAAIGIFVIAVVTTYLQLQR